MLFFSSQLFGQKIQIDSCGLNNDSRLNNYEVEYFKEAHDYQHNNSLDLVNYRILFLPGNMGSRGSSNNIFSKKWKVLV